LGEIAKPVIILLIGDADPSGHSIMDSGCEDIKEFGTDDARIALSRACRSAYEIKVSWIREPRETANRD
jgi:hypothetical protein